MPSGLKISNRQDVTLFDTSWTAGVDYNEELFNEQEEDADYESDETSSSSEKS